MGYNLQWQNNQAIIDKSQKFDGNRISIDIQSEPANTNFGDLHSHPADAVGHINGYCAHSLYDVQAIKNNLQKPLFVRFVASGDEVYAMIYRQGHSTFNQTWVTDNIEQQKHDQWRYFEEQTGLDYMAVQEKMAEAEDKEKVDPEAWMLEFKRTIPRLGPTFQKLSIQYCKQAANTMHLGFYHGDRWLIGRTFNTDLTLDLLAS